MPTAKPADKPAERPASVRVALESFVGSVGTAVVRVHKGDLFWSDDPAVVKWPALFGEPVVKTSSGAPSPRVEAATAAPGEKRGA